MASKLDTAQGTRPSHLLPKEPRPLRVVIVEDEPIIALQLETLLEELEAEVVGIAMNAAEAGIHVGAYHPDFVTMDINIRGSQDGVDVAQDIFDKYGVRSIFVSAYSDIVTRKRAETCHPIGWVVKPVDRSKLAALLSQVTSHTD